MDQLIEVQTRMGSDVERLKGSDLERRYRERAHAYFSRLLRRIHVLSGDELMALLEEAVTRKQLSEDEADDILQADMVIRGRRREDGTEVYGVVEVSWGSDSPMSSALPDAPLYSPEPVCPLSRLSPASGSPLKHKSQPVPSKSGRSPTDTS